MARTGHEDRHVSWGSSSLLLLGGLGEPGLEGKDEGDPKEAWLAGSGTGHLEHATYQPIILYRVVVNEVFLWPVNWTFEAHLFRMNI